jgi:hypothetical protein
VRLIRHARALKDRKKERRPEAPPIWNVGILHAALRRRRMRPRATNPAPSNASDAGSGVVTGFRTNCRLAEADWLAAEKVIRNCSSSDVTLDMAVEIGPKVETGPLRVCVTTWAPLTKIFSVAGPGEPISALKVVYLCTAEHR